MAYTQTQLDALETAMAEGVMSVQYSDRRVTYHSLAEMERLRATMRRELGLTDTKVTRRFAATSKGL